MLLSLLYVLLAILGLGFLVFIHELGHYWMARRQGMRVEAFAIGFGKPVYTWTYQGVQWHLCWLPFGGYVKIAGMHAEGSKEPSEIPDGFYGKKPWQRIKVALAGPLVNVLFAALAFSVLWAAGGLYKPFSEYTHRIGWVDPKSPLYAKGVRPGDFITTYNGKAFQGLRDLLIAGVMNQGTVEMTGYRLDDQFKQKEPFHYTLPSYSNPSLGEIGTIGIMAPARYLIVQGEIPAGSPMRESGIQQGDRLLWADGELLFSPMQLSALINESSAFLTLERNGEILHAKVPRMQLNALKVSAAERGEIEDWQYEAALKGRLQDLYFVPYNLSPTLEVEGALPFLDEEEELQTLSAVQRSSYFLPLQEGDRILAVDGVEVQWPHELLQRLQQRRVLVIVQRETQQVAPLPWNRADAAFDSFDAKALAQMVASIGVEPVASTAQLHLLQPVVPKTLLELSRNPEGSSIEKELSQVKRGIEERFKDPQKRFEALHEWEKTQKKAVLGLPLADREVIYNPSPLQQFKDVFEMTWRTLKGLFQGMNPKYMSGPVGIVQMVHHGWSTGPKEALFWMALISLNLGIFNLLPIPVLDGGHIIFSLFEVFTRRPLRAKTMERLVIPFVILLVALFLYITYNDLQRLFHRFF